MTDNQIKIIRQISALLALEVPGHPPNLETYSLSTDLERSIQEPLIKEIDRLQKIIRESQQIHVPNLNELEHYESKK